MYSRNFGTNRSAPPPPPSYSGVMYPREEVQEELSREEQPEENAITLSGGEYRAEKTEERAEKKGLLGTLFGRTLTFEDLLLVGLIIMLMDSGADDELLIILAFLLLAGR